MAGATASRHPLATTFHQEIIATSLRAQRVPTRFMEVVIRLSAPPHAKLALLVTPVRIQLGYPNRVPQALTRAQQAKRVV